MNCYMNAKLFDLSGKVAIVTGSGRGLGKVMAGGLADFGAKVVTRTAADYRFHTNGSTR